MAEMKDEKAGPVQKKQGEEGKAPFNIFGSFKPGQTKANIFKLPPGNMNIFESTKTMIKEDKERKAAEPKKEFNAATLFGTSYSLGTETKLNKSSPFFCAGNSTNLFAEAKKKGEQAETKEDEEKDQETEDAPSKLKEDYKKTTAAATDSAYYKMFQIQVVKFTAGEENKGQGLLSFEVLNGEGKEKPVAGDKVKTAVLVLRDSLGRMRFQGVIMRPVTRMQKNDEKPGRIASDLWIPMKAASGKLKMTKCRLKFKYMWDRTEFEEAFKTVIKMLPKPK